MNLWASFNKQQLVYLCDYYMTVRIRQLYFMFFNFQENTCVEHHSSVHSYKATLNISENEVGKNNFCLILS